MSDDVSSQEERAELDTASRARRPSVFDQLRSFLLYATRGGLFPLVAYSVSETTHNHEHDSAETREVDDGDNDDSTDDDLTALNNQPDTAAAEHDVRILTTAIPNLALGVRILESATQFGYNLGRRFSPQRLAQLKDQNPHVFFSHERRITGIDPTRIASVGRMISRFGAPFLRTKGFALIDICGFSRLTHSDQLAYLYSLTNMLDSSIRRTRRFCTELKIKNSFGRNSTGDGYYFWHDGIGGRSDVVTLMALVCLLSQGEFMKREGFSMQLKGTFVIDSAFLFYDATAKELPGAAATNAIGAATNGAARLMTATQPGQLLVGDFLRSGQGKEQLNPKAVIAQVNELFRAEGSGAATLALVPDAKLRVADKHGDIWYCYNVCGNVPCDVGGNLHDVPIGLESDDSKSIAAHNFRPTARPDAL